MAERDDGLTDDARDLLRRLVKNGYLCWNSEKMEGPAHDLIMAGYAQGSRPPRHRNWYIDISPEGRAYAKTLQVTDPASADDAGDETGKGSAGG
jgi:hypothetical protein